MRTLTGYRRLLILAITASILAACSAPVGPSASLTAALPTPSANPTVSPVPTASLVPSPTTGSPPGSPVPTQKPECPPLTDYALNPFVDAGFDIGNAGVTLQVTQVAPVSNPTAIQVPEPRDPGERATGVLLGGHEFRANPSYFYDVAQGPTMLESVTAILRPAGADPLVLPVRLEPGNEYTNQVAIAVPDLDGLATLDIEMTWSDDCFRYTASGSSPVDVIPTAATAACSLTEAGYWADLKALLALGLSVGTSAARLAAPIHWAKYLPSGDPGIDFNAIYLWDREGTTIVAAPDSVLVINGPSPDLDLDNMESTIMTRRSVANAVGDYPPKIVDVVLRRSPERRPDGSFPFRVPSEPGRYVAAVSFDFESTCAIGRADAVFSVTVTPPASPAPSSAPEP